MSVTYTGPVYVAHFAAYGADGRLVAARHRRVPAPSQNTAEAFAQDAATGGWKLVGVRPATSIDKQAWL